MVRFGIYFTTTTIKQQHFIGIFCHGTTMSDQPEDTTVSMVMRHHQKPSLSRSSRIWHSQEAWLIEQRQYKARIEKDGIKGIELFEAMTTRNLEHKFQTKAQHRCPNCWHVTTTTTDGASSPTVTLNSSTSPPEQSQKNQTLVVDHCICDQLEPLVMRKTVTTTASTTTTATTATNHHHQVLPNNVELLILMHQKEWMCGGNSAKLLLQLLPDHCELFLFGKLGEVDRLFRRMMGKMTTTGTKNNESDEDDYGRTQIADPMLHTMILWPSPEACSVTQFLQQSRRRQSSNNGSRQKGCSMSQAIDHNNNNNNNSSSSRNESSSTIDEQEEILKVVVLDGTYTQARNMRKSLRKRIRKGQVPLAKRSSSSSSSSSSCGVQKDEDEDEDEVDDEDEKKSRIHQITRMPQDVMIRPETESIFHRAQKNYGQAHQQRRSKSSSISSSSSSSTTTTTSTSTNPKRKEKALSDDAPDSQVNGNENSSSSPPPPPPPPLSGDDECGTSTSMTPVARRVSTAEACGMLLVELGADASVQERILEAIKINNQSLATARARQNMINVRGGV